MEEIPIKLGNKQLSHAEYLDHVHSRAKKLDSSERASYLSGATGILNAKNHPKSKSEIYIPYIFAALAFIGLFILLTIYPIPSFAQFFVMRCLTASAVALLALGFSGSFEFKAKWVKGTGAFGVFALIFLVNPAKFIFEDQITKINVTISINDSSRLQTFSFDLHRNEQNFAGFCRTSLKNYIGDQCVLDSFKCINKSDGKLYDKETCEQITEENVLMLSNKTIRSCGSIRAAYLRFQQ